MFFLYAAGLFLLVSLQLVRLFKQLMYYLVSCFIIVCNENFTSPYSVSSTVNKIVCGILAVYETASIIRTVIELN
jgi:hypothetical protein